MSTRCQIEFKSGGVRRTVYRHSDGYPSAVIPDLLAFLAWSTRGGDVEYEAANFLYWSKRELDERSAQLGFGICANDELHGDVEYYYVVEHLARSTIVRAYAIEHEDGAVHLGRLVQEVRHPFFSSLMRHSGLYVGRLVRGERWATVPSPFVPGRRGVGCTARSGAPRHLR